MSQNEPLPVETYALALAHLIRRRREPVAEVLASIGVSVEAFSAAERHWTEELAEAFVRRKGALAMSFSAAWARAQREVGLLGPAIEDRSAAAWAPPATAVASRPDVPSFLRAEQELAPVAPTAPSAPSAPPEAPAPARSETAGRPAHIAALAETRKMDNSAIVAAVQRGRLPFALAEPTGKVAPAEPTGKAVAAEPRSDERKTVELRIEPPAGEEIDLAMLPLETYASVCAALAHGEPRAEALARHGVSADTFDKLGKAWAQRFQREPHLVARFKELATGKAAAGRPGG